MPDQVVSIRYAQALFDAIDDPGQLDEICAEVQAIAALIEENAQLKAFLEGPSIVEAHKHSLVDETFAGKVEPLTLDFLHLLLDKHRMDHFGEVAHAFTRLVEERRRQIRVRLTTACTLSADVLDRMKRAMDRAIGLDCILESRIDERVLGGAVAVFGDRVIDGSLRTSLEDLRRQLRKAPL